MNENQTKEVVKKEEPAAVPEIIPEKAQEEVQRKTIRERISILLASIGIESPQSKVMLFSVLAIVFSSVLASFFLMPPSDFPQDKIIVIKNGASLGQVSLLLSSEHLIRSQILFELCAMTVGGDKGVRAGQYVFKTPIGACAMALRITEGISGIPAIKITIPEGVSNKEASVILSGKLPQFDAVLFMEHTRPLEGYLFPDTYFFSEGSTAQDVETMMKSTFDKKIEGIKSQIDSSGHSLREAVIMASILEREATTDADRDLVSGILWKRIKNGMPLQVDAPFLYLLGKKSNELTQADLQIKSTYNTYRNKGLPGGPIGNPGLSAIRSAISPKDSPYLYYLSDDKGVMHYAKTFAEHAANKTKYLR